MKIKQILFLVIFAFGQVLCFGQTDKTNKEFKAKMDSPIYILKVDDKSVEYDSRKNKNLNLNAIDPSNVQSISVLKGNEAKDKYGNRGQDGVVIISFKDFNLLPKELQRMFCEPSIK